MKYLILSSTSFTSTSVIISSGSTIFYDCKLRLIFNQFTILTKKNSIILSILTIRLYNYFNGLQQFCPLFSQNMKYLILSSTSFTSNSVIISSGSTIFYDCKLRLIYNQFTFLTKKNSIFSVSLTGGSMIISTVSVNSVIPSSKT